MKRETVQGPEDWSAEKRALLPTTTRRGAGYDARADRPLSTRGFALTQDVILDSETRKSVAVVRNGQVFRDGQEGEKIATVVGSSLYDLNGYLIGYLDEGQLINRSPRSIPIIFRDLLEGSN